MLTVLGLTFLATVLVGVPIAFSLGLAAAATLVAWGQVPLWLLAQRRFSGIGGSAVADAAALSAVLSPSMAKQYDPDFGNGVVASAAMLGPIIPPSIPMVVYALAAGGVSIAGLFIAGVIPGIVLAAGMMAIAYVIAKRRG